MKHVRPCAPLETMGGERVSFQLALDRGWLFVRLWFRSLKMLCAVGSAPSFPPFYSFLLPGCSKLNGLPFSGGSWVSCKILVMSLWKLCAFLSLATQLWDGKAELLYWASANSAALVSALSGQDSWGLNILGLTNHMYYLRVPRTPARYV